MTIRVSLEVAVRLLVYGMTALGGRSGLAGRFFCGSPHVGDNMRGGDAYCGSCILRSTEHAGVRQLRPTLLRCGHFVLAPYP